MRGYSKLRDSGVYRIDRDGLPYRLGSNVPQATILTIEMENVVRYNENFASPQKNGTSNPVEAQ